MFSPYYAAARRRGPTDPRAHVAFNVALYRKSGARWAMTERGATALDASRHQLRIGLSSIAWRDGALHLAIDERAAPLPRRLRGVITLHPGPVFADPVSLDPAGRHRWTPFAPCARADIVFDAPEMRWSGSAYFDSNAGDAPLEADFTHWEWSRAPCPDGSTVIFYDALRQDGTRLDFARRFRPDGTAEPMDLPPRAPLPHGLWGVARTTHGTAPILLRALEDGPFYTRSLVTTTLDGLPVTAVHESLSLIRFRRAWVRALLPFRMPRR